MKQIRLIASDFDTVNVDGFFFSVQYTKTNDCPIARALKRVVQNPDSVNVGPDIANFDGKRVRIDGGIVSVSECLQSINNGNKFAIIKVKQ